MGHLLGYARVSTTDQQPHLQVDALQRAGCYRVFTETASGARTDHPTLTQLLDQLRPGDTLVVWKLDRLGRSLRHLVDTVTGLADRGIGFRSLQEAIDTTTPGGKLVFHVFAALAEMVAAIAKTQGVSRASVYRHLNWRQPLTRPPHRCDRFFKRRRLADPLHAIHGTPSRMLLLLSVRRWSRPEHNCPLGTAVVPCCPLLRAPDMPQGRLWVMSHLSAVPLGAHPSRNQPITWFLG